MGWCSGTDVFDTVYKEFIKLGQKANPRDIIEAVSHLIEVLEDNDWDCQSDSIYWDYPIVKKARILLNPQQSRIQELEDIRDKAIAELRSINAN